MAARQEATDTQIAEALRQGLPHLTQATTTQPALLAADVFAAALGAIPSDDWCSTWAAGRTIMLREDLEESQRFSGQDTPACRCPLVQELLGRRPQWHSR
jgi:hypothetical protein